MVKFIFFPVTGNLARFCRDYTGQSVVQRWSKMFTTLFFYTVDKFDHNIYNKGQEVSRYNKRKLGAVTLTASIVTHIIWPISQIQGAGKGSDP